MKRNLIIAAMAIVLIGLLVGLYFLFFSPSAHLTTSPGGSFNNTGSGTVNSTNTIEPGTGATTAGTTVAPNLVEITTSPVSAGEVLFDIPPTQIPGSTQLSSTSASSTQSTPTFIPGDVVVRYIDRESGNVYSYLALTRKLARISNKTLPGIQEASWLPDGSMAFVRFLTNTNGSSHISTYALPFDGNGGYFLQQDLAQAIVTGSSTVFTLSVSTGSSVGTTAHADGTSPQTLFTSPLTSILMRGFGVGLTAVTKASAELDGYAFSLSGGVFTPVLGPLKGLTVLPSPSGKILLYSYTDGSVFHMATFDLGQATAVRCIVRYLTLSQGIFLMIGIKAQPLSMTVYGALISPQDSLLSY